MPVATAMVVVTSKLQAFLDLPSTHTHSRGSDTFVAAVRMKIDQVYIGASLNQFGPVRRTTAEVDPAVNREGVR